MVRRPSVRSPLAAKEAAVEREHEWTGPARYLRINPATAPLNANMSGQDRSRYLAGKPAAHHPLKANVSGRDR
ncbi:hypothetical protein [Geobacillus subterraneus]|uniref:hypothetical protein n=1 Tax=unclassified Geobacillus TaxID=2642459 RepID=UPI0005396358